MTRHHHISPCCLLISNKIGLSFKLRMIPDIFFRVIDGFINLANYEVRFLVSFAYHDVS